MFSYYIIPFLLLFTIFQTSHCDESLNTTTTESNNATIKTPTTESVIDITKKNLTPQNTTTAEGNKKSENVSDENSSEQSPSEDENIVKGNLKNNTKTTVEAKKDASKSKLSLSGKNETLESEKQSSTNITINAQNTTSTNSTDTNPLTSPKITNAVGSAVTQTLEIIKDLFVKTGAFFFSLFKNIGD